ncbi:MAG: FtsX-like permease family protein [Myxococcota bacterium]|jgi:hypothetical protein|nr:FtsX-like permease family protein [Myxococcota bacterium]
MKLPPRVEGHLALVDRAVGSLLRGWARALPEVLVFTLVIFLCGSLLFTTDGLRLLADQTLAASPELIVQRVIGGRAVPIPLTHAARLSDHPAVRRVRPRVWGSFYDATRQDTYTLMSYLPGEGPPPGARILEQTLRLDALGADEVLVGRGYAREEGLRPGDEVILTDSTGRPRIFRLAGLFTAATDLWTHDLVLVQEPALRELLGLAPGEASDLVVDLHAPEEQEAVASRLAGLLPDCRVLTRDGLRRGYHSAFGWKSGAAMGILAVLLLAFATLVWSRAAGPSQQESKEIGVLRAVGWQVREVLLLQLWRGTLVALLAYALGVLGAFLHVFRFEAVLLRPLLAGWTSLYPRFDLPPSAPGGTLLLLLFCSWGPYVCALLLPAWRTALVDPERVLRGLA